MCDHENREAAMAVIERNAAGVPTVWCDPCLAPIVTALNAAGIRTVASCCGHGRAPGLIALADGRELRIEPSFEAARRTEKIMAAAGEWRGIDQPLREDVPAHDPGHPHLIGGEFQSDKYPTCPRGKVPLSCKDPTAQDLLWEYAQRRRAVDAEFAADLEEALRRHGYTPIAAVTTCPSCCGPVDDAGVSTAVPKLPAGPTPAERIPTTPAIAARAEIRREVVGALEEAGEAALRRAAAPANPAPGLAMDVVFTSDAVLAAVRSDDPPAPPVITPEIAQQLADEGAAAGREYMARTRGMQGPPRGAAGPVVVAASADHDARMAALATPEYLASLDEERGDQAPGDRPSPITVLAGALRWEREEGRSTPVTDEIRERLLRLDALTAQAVATRESDIAAHRLVAAVRARLEQHGTPAETPDLPGILAALDRLGAAAARTLPGSIRAAQDREIVEADARAQMELRGAAAEAMRERDDLASKLAAARAAIEQGCARYQELTQLIEQKLPDGTESGLDEHGDAVRRVSAAGVALRASFAVQLTNRLSESGRMLSEVRAQLEAERARFAAEEQSHLATQAELENERRAFVVEHDAHTATQQQLEGLRRGQTEARAVATGLAALFSASHDGTLRDVLLRVRYRVEELQGMYAAVSRARDRARLAIRRLEAAPKSAAPAARPASPRRKPTRKTAAVAKSAPAASRARKGGRR